MSPVRRVLYILTLRCDESARLQSEAMDRRLAVYERAAMGLHLVSCRGCKRYRRFLRVLRALVRAVAIAEMDTHPDGPRGLSAESKSRMKLLLGRMG